MGVPFSRQESLTATTARPCLMGAQAEAQVVEWKHLLVAIQEGGLVVLDDNLSAAAVGASRSSSVSPSS